MGRSTEWIGRLKSKTNAALLEFLAIGAYFLWTEHRAHVIQVLPYGLLLGCLAMHFFMHRKHGRGGGDGQGLDARSPGEER